MSVAHALEHSEHISHGGHGGSDKLGTYIGLTMAILGVLLAFCSAMVGAERTLLVQKLVEQQHAHAKYQAQDVKHRVAFLAVAQVHASAFGVANPTVNKQSLMSMVQNVNRYLEESRLAKAWTNSFDKIISVHMEAQEEYEHGLLASEIGIVIASVALLMRRKVAWYLAMALGILAIVIAAKTMVHVKHEAKEAEHTIAAAEAKYEEARKANKTTTAEEELIKSITSWAGEKPAAAMPPSGKATEAKSTATPAAH